MMLRIPAWANDVSLSINGELTGSEIKGDQYISIEKNLKKGDVIKLHFPLKAKLIETHPLVEENRNQVAVQYGPIVYCLEGADLPEGCNLFDISIPKDIELKPVPITIGSADLKALEGEFIWNKRGDWNGSLYRAINTDDVEKVTLKLIPYFAWDNRGLTEMSVWLPLD